MWQISGKFTKQMNFSAPSPYGNESRNKSLEANVVFF